MTTSYEYLAGFVDGEGHIGIKKHTRFLRSKSECYYERISVANTNKEIIDIFKKEFGGYVYHHKPSKLSNNSYWSWEVTNKQARIMLEKIYPYLIVKKIEADVVMELTKSKEKKYSQVPDKVNEFREYLFQKVKLIRKISE